MTMHNEFRMTPSLAQPAPCARADGHALAFSPVAAPARAWSTPVLARPRQIGADPKVRPSTDQKCGVVRTG
jgi:hypothetical protein